MRLRADIRISIKNLRTGETYKLELIRQPTGYRRFWLRYNGKNSRKWREITLTELFQTLRTWLKKF